MKQPIATTVPTTTVAILQPAPSTGRPVVKPTTSKQKRATKTIPGEKQGGRRGSKRRKAGVDPNAPKKPSNAFFWFCQERKPSLQDQFKGRGVAGQHDLTKVLAKLWSEITPEDKKVMPAALLVHHGYIICISEEMYIIDIAWQLVLYGLYSPEPEEHSP